MIYRRRHPPYHEPFDNRVYDNSIRPPSKKLFIEKEKIRHVENKIVYLQNYIARDASYNLL